MGPLARTFASLTWRKTAWWALIYLLLAALEGAFFPTARQQAATMNALLNSMPAGLRKVFGGHDLQRFSGWMSVEFFSYFALLAAIALSLIALDTVLRERDRRTLEEWLALPISRAAFFWARVGTWLVLALAAEVPVAILLWAMGRGFGEPLGAGGWVGALLEAFAVAAVCGAAVVLATVALSDLGGGMAAALGLPFGTYMANVALQAAGKWPWLQRLLPFHYFNPDAALAAAHPVWGTLGGLLAVAAALLVLAWWVFERREVAG